VLGVPRAEKLITPVCSVIGVSNVDRARARDDTPELVAVLVGLEANRLTLLHGDNLHGRLLVERKAFEVAPRALLFLVVGESFHMESISVSMRGCDKPR